MAALSLKISIVEQGVTKTMQFEPATTVYDACRIIREKITEANLGQPKDYGLFLADEDAKIGVWLEPGRSLNYYILKGGETLEYKRKLRQLRVRMLDGTIKTMLVDDSQNVANLMVVICTKIGITNHDEYSLVREILEDELENKPGNYGTLTLKRRKEEGRERDAKMEQLRKKLKTDDEVNWVDPSKTLREQGIDETETVLLRRKFFFSDQNIDSRDPVQLNLLYVQARDAILDGTHPVTLDKACEFAGIQCQNQFGDYVESKHKPGFLDLKEFLPQSYVKVKNVEKKVFSEHRKHIGVSELDAKVLYTKTARDLKTYGVSFFLEKMKGKNKLVPRLLGVTKESVLRLDERTKEILKTWPLTTVRRWGASPNTFTLDFGDYSDQYYSVQTTEAEQILQLISGYIDIILKKKQSKDHFGIEGDEGSTMVEDSVSPYKATILQHETCKTGKVNTESLAKPAIMRAGADGARPYGTGHMGGAQFTTVTGQANISHSAAPMIQQTKVTTVMSEPQRALLGTINAGHDAISAAEHELQTKAQLPKLGNDPASMKWKETTMETNKQSVSSQIAAMNAATAQVVTLTSGPSEDVDHNAVGAAISTITSNLPEMTRGVRMIAALIDDDDGGDKLMDAARRLCSAFSDMLKAAEPEAKEPRQSLLNAAGRVGEASHAVLASIGEEDDSSRELQEMLLSLAKAVANTTAALVLKAKNIAAACDDQNTQNQVIGAATQCALATSQLVACAKVVAPTLQNAACQEQLVGAVREVARAVEQLVSTCQEAQPEQKLMGDLNGAVAEVTRSLNDLLHHIKFTVNERGRENIHDDAVETIIVTTDRMMAVSGDSAEMVRQARILGRATAQLIQAIKGEAETQEDTEVQRRLLTAAKVLADATARMVEAARLCASSPHDANHQDALRHAAEEIRAATTNASTPAMRARIINRLENSAKQVASCATQTMSAAQGSLPYNTNQVVHQHLLSECRHLADQVPKLVESLKATSSRPEDPECQLTLIETSESILQPGSRVVQSTRGAMPTVSDQASSTALGQSSQQLASSLSDLRSAASRAREACGPGLELESAERLVAGMREELAAFERQVQMSQLRPLPGDNADVSSLQLGSSAQNVVASMAKLASSAAQGNESYTGREARATAAALSDFTNSVRGVAATTNDKAMQTKIILNAEEVMERSLLFLDEARKAVIHGHDHYDVRTLSQCGKRVQQSIEETINCLPSQKDVDEAINIINEASQILNMGEFPPSSRPYGQLQQDLHTAAANLNDASTGVAVSVGSPGELADSSKKFGENFTDLLTICMEMAGQTADSETRSQMLMSLKSVTMTSSSLLITAKSVAADPTAPNAKNKLSGAARAVTDSINYLVDVCTSSAPGQKECDNALRNIQAMKPLLDNPCEPVSEATYFECLDSVMEKSKSLGDGMTGIANHAKKGQHTEFASSVRNTSAAICGLVEAAAQSAYLVGVSDPSSMSGRPGLIDQAMCSRASHAINTACQHLANQASSQQQVLSAATVIAKHTSALCNACRIASAQTHNPVAKRHFVQSAKDVANSTANLVKEIKALDRDYSPINRERCAVATQPLLDAVDSLCTFASSSEFASVPGRISEEARRSQQPITQAGRSIIDGSCAMIGAAKSLAVNPRDPPTWQVLANHSKSVSDSIKRLVASIRDKAPGQRECDAAVEVLNKKIRDLDQASLDAVSQGLRPRKELTPQGYREQTEASASEILDRLEPLRSAAKFEAEKIGHSVNQVSNYIEPLVAGSIGAASTMSQSKQQMVLLDQTKSVVESVLQLVFATKEGGGNPKAVNIHPDIDEACDTTKEALQDLGGSLEKLATQAGIVTGIVESISRSMVRITDQRVAHMNTNMSFVDFQTRMVTCAKELARISQEMVGKAGTSDTSKLALLGGELARQYAQLAVDAGGASSATTNPDVAQRLTTGVHDLGQSCIDLVRSGGNCQPGDSFAQREVAEAGRSVSEKVSQVLAALQAGSRGTQACINAASTVSGIIGDLDTTIMFATAGTLHAEGEGETFADHREQILKTAKALVEDTKTLVAGAASSQEQLAVAAQNAVTTIVQLAEVVKYGAASLGSNNPEAQVMLINAVKDVASALGDLIQATKAASGKSITDPSMNHLKDSAKVMVTNVTSLLKTVKAVEDEHSRGTRALEATIEAIGQEIRALQSSEHPKIKVNPEDLVRCAKPITQATAKAVAAGNSGKQDDIIVAANMGRKAISDMLTICKASAFQADSKELRQRTIESGFNVSTQYRELLQVVLTVLERPGSATELKHNMSTISRRIAQFVTELVSAAEMLKGSDMEDPDDPTVIAENELLGAAASIDAAAKKLASLRPRRSIQEADESLNFDEMILEAAKSIAAATSALVKAASAAQRELIEHGKVSRRPLCSSDDGQWSEGLISAARLVAAATHSLVESANGLVQGVSGEEKLISAAKQVASSTAQLLVACKVKADPDSASTKRLQAAGNAVKRATDNLVRAAQQASAQEEERSLVLNKRMVGGMAQEINARSDVLRIERELEEARGRLTAVRQARYKIRAPGAGSGEDTGDEGGYGSGYESFTSRYETRTFNDQSQSPSHQMYASTPLKPSSLQQPQQPQQPQQQQQQQYQSQQTPSPAHQAYNNGNNGTSSYSHSNGTMSTFGTPVRSSQHQQQMENSQQSYHTSSEVSSSNQRVGAEEAMMQMMQKSSQRIERSVTTVTQQQQQQTRQQFSTFRTTNQQS